MEPPTDATNMNSWLRDLIRLAKEGRIVSTSSGAGPGRDYAYLHYATDDGSHAVLVFRSTHEASPEVLAYRCETAPQEDVAKLVDELTHAEATAHAS